MYYFIKVAVFQCSYLFTSSIFSGWDDEEILELTNQIARLELLVYNWGYLNKQRVLLFPRRHEEKTQWCWAAVAEFSTKPLNGKSNTPDWWKKTSLYCPEAAQIYISSRNVMQPICHGSYSYSQAFISEVSGAGVSEEAHTGAWRDVHAPAMHEACTQWHTCRLPAAFYQKTRSTALHCLLTRPPDNGAEEFTVCCHCYRTASPRIAVSPPVFPECFPKIQLSPHAICCKHTPSARNILANSPFFLFYPSKLNRTHTFLQITSSSSVLLLL